MLYRNLSDWEAEFAKANLLHIWEKIKSYSRPSLKLNLKIAQESDFKLGQSKIGGLPHLPPQIDWESFVWDTYPLHFIAQFNLKEIHPFNIRPDLPKEGMLYFFYPLDEMPTWNFHKEIKRRV